MSDAMSLMHLQGRPCMAILPLMNPAGQPCSLLRCQGEPCLAVISDTRLVCYTNEALSPEPCNLELSLHFHSTTGSSST